MKRWVAVVAIVPLVAAVLGAGPAGARTESRATISSSSPGYWLLTGAGATYAYDAPYLGTQMLESIQSPCENNFGYGPYPGPSCVGISATPGGLGYWIGESSYFIQSNQVTRDLDGIPVGDTGSCIGRQGPAEHVVAPGVGVAAAPVGAWIASDDGGVFAVCGAGYYGSMGGHQLNKPIVGIAPTPGGKGYWLVASDGGVFAFGDAPYLGSMGGKSLNRPIVGMAATPDGLGYWLVASDGGVFAFGNAGFYGSMGNKDLNAPMVGIAPGPDGTGYWTVASDGGVFAFGDAPFLGSAAGQTLDAPVVGIASRG